MQNLVSSGLRNKLRCIKTLKVNGDILRRTGAKVPSPDGIALQWT